MCEERYRDLANAVIVQAVTDYRADRKKLERIPMNQKEINEEREAKADMRRIEKFFSSDWFGLLSGVDGDYILKRIKAIDKKRIKQRK